MENMRRREGGMSRECGEGVEIVQMYSLEVNQGCMCYETCAGGGGR